MDYFDILGNMLIALLSRTVINIVQSHCDVAYLFVDDCLEFDMLATVILAFWMQKRPYLDERVELSRIDVSTNDCVTQSRKLAAAVNHSVRKFNIAIL